MKLNKAFMVVAVLLPLTSCTSMKVNTLTMTDSELQKCKSESALQSNRVACANALMDRASHPVAYVPPAPKKEINYVNQAIDREWVKIDKTMSFRKEYSDNESLRAWVRLASKNKNHSHSMHEWTVNCKYKTLSTGKSILYSKNGEVLDSYTDTAPAEGIVPETTGEAFYYFACLQ